MRRFTPVTAFVLILTAMSGVLVADYALRGGFSRSAFERVSPDRQGFVRIEVGDLEPQEVRFYRFLNSGSQEVKFFVGRDDRSQIQVAFDAAESDFKMGRGFRVNDGWMVNNKCDTAVRLSEINDGRGGCRPVPLAHQLQGDTLVLAENDILKGWRLFR